MQAAYVCSKVSLFTVHALAGLENAISFLRVLPNRANDACRRGHGLARHGGTINAVRMMLVQLGELSIDPRGAMGALEESTARMNSVGGHGAGVFGRDQENGVGEIPVLNYMMDRPKLIQRNLGERRRLGGNIRRIRRNGKQNFDVGGRGDGGQGSGNIQDEKYRCGIDHDDGTKP
jgi:hypothetical protein